MTLWQLINTSREQYLDIYRQAIARQRETAPTLTPEVAVRPNGADHVPIDYQVFRVDLMWLEQESPRIGLVDSPPVSAMAPLQTDYPDGQQVTVHSFRWDECLIHFAPALQSDVVLVNWLRQWRDRPDGSVPDSDGLHSAVHSMTPPQRQEGFTVVLVDFGSAAPEAFTSLISTLLSGGARTIHITTLPPVPSATTNL